MKYLLLILLLMMYQIKAAQVYDISESDLIQELQKKETILKRKIEEDLNNSMNKVLKSSQYNLKKAKKSFYYYIDPTYTLERDIIYYDYSERKWKVLYPKGYRFNPIEYMKVTPPPMIVFNPCDEKEFKKVEDITGLNTLKYMLISSGCSIEEINNQIKRRKLDQIRMFTLTKELKEKLKIEYTISVIEVDQSKKAIKVTVIPRE